MGQGGKRKSGPDARRAKSRAADKTWVESEIRFGDGSRRDLHCDMEEAASYCRWCHFGVLVLMLLIWGGLINGGVAGTGRGEGVSDKLQLDWSGSNPIQLYEICSSAHKALDWTDEMINWQTFRWCPVFRVHISYDVLVRNLGYW
jgi:hypothetical protein